MWHHNIIDLSHAQLVWTNTPLWPIEQLGTALNLLSVEILFVNTNLRTNINWDCFLSLRFESVLWIPPLVSFVPETWNNMISWHILPIVMSYTFKFCQMLLDAFSYKDFVKHHIPVWTFIMLISEYTDSKPLPVLCSGRHYTESI